MWFLLRFRSKLRQIHLCYQGEGPDTEHTFSWLTQELCLAESRLITPGPHLDHASHWGEECSY